MKLISKRIQMSVAALALTFAMSATALAYSYWYYAPNDTIPFWQPYSQRQADWWKWALTQPAATNPVLDTTGQFCAQGQSGSNWFLAGTFDGTPVTRSCTIPASKTVVFPLANEAWLAFPTDPAEEQTDTFVRAQNLATPQTTVTLKINGIAQYVPNYFVSLKESKIFNTVLSDVFGEELEGQVISKGADKGFYAAVKLGRGTHKIEWTANGPGISQNVTYNITAQ